MRLSGPNGRPRTAVLLLTVVLSSTTLTACHELYCNFVEGLTGVPVDCSHDGFPDLPIELPPLPPPPSLPTTTTTTIQPATTTSSVPVGDTTTTSTPATTTTSSIPVGDTTTTSSTSTTTSSTSTTTSSSTTLPG
jgi:hypothetical protein